MPVAQRLPSAPMQISPGITHPPSRLCLSDLRHGVPCKFRALTIMAALPRRAASYPLPVRQASALPSASSRFAVARDTLAVRLTLPLAGRVEDFHLQVSALCRAHQQKRQGRFRPRPHFNVSVAEALRLRKIPIHASLSGISNHRVVGLGRQSGGCGRRCGEYKFLTW
jgi:hypothetical protein